MGLIFVQPWASGLFCFCLGATHLTSSDKGGMFLATETDYKGELILLKDFYWLYLKFVERERRFTFFKRHPQLSFLGVAFMLSAVICTNTNPSVTANSHQHNTIPNLDTPYSQYSDQTLASLANSDLNENSKVLRAALSLTEIPSTPSYTRFDDVRRDGLAESATVVSSAVTKHFADNIDTVITKLQNILDIPFDAETQNRILEEACDGDLRMFCLAMTMANKESKFVPNLIGDNGLSYGYYQIKTDSHKDRIAKYGFTNEDLFDPVKGAIVCVDYLRELLWTYQGSGEVTHFLFMMYNQGPSSARSSVAHMVTSTGYSREAMEIYESYLAEVGLEPGVPFEQ